jgi:hypothetical protein
MILSLAAHPAAQPESRRLRLPACARTIFGSSAVLWLLAYYLAWIPIGFAVGMVHVIWGVSL